MAAATDKSLSLLWDPFNWQILLAHAEMHAPHVCECFFFVVLSATRLDAFGLCWHVNGCEGLDSNCHSVVVFWMVQSLAFGCNNERAQGNIF